MKESFDKKIKTVEQVMIGLGYEAGVLLGYSGFLFIVLWIITR